VHDSKREARIHAPTINVDRARPALTVVAALLRTGKLKSLAQRVEECGASVELQTARLAVDFERDFETLPNGVRTGRLRLRLPAGKYSNHGRSSSTDQDASSRHFRFDGVCHVISRSLCVLS
jgi:hypothetical protein